MKAAILGNAWTLLFPGRINRKGDWGQCDSKERTIKVLKALRGQNRLEIVLHEMLHAAGWHIDEEFVAEFSRDAAQVLTDLGYTDGE